MMDSRKGKTPMARVGYGYDGTITVGAVIVHCSAFTVDQEQELADGNEFGQADPQYKRFDEGQRGWTLSVTMTPSDTAWIALATGTLAFSGKFVSTGLTFTGNVRYATISTSVEVSARAQHVVKFTGDGKYTIG